MRWCLNRGAKAMKQIAARYWQRAFSTSSGAGFSLFAWSHLMRAKLTLAGYAPSKTLYSISDAKTHLPSGFSVVSSKRTLSSRSHAGLGHVICHG